MHQVRFEGTIETTDQGAIVDIISAWIGMPKVRVRVIGEEIIYNDNGAFLRSHILTVGAESLPWHNFEGHLDSETGAAEKKLKELIAICGKHGYECDLEYSVYDESGQQVGQTLDLP